MVILVWPAANGFISTLPWAKNMLSCPKQMINMDFWCHYGPNRIWLFGGMVSVMMSYTENKYCLLCIFKLSLWNFNLKISFLPFLFPRKIFTYIHTNIHTYTLENHSFHMVDLCEPQHIILHIAVHVNNYTSSNRAKSTIKLLKNSFWLQWWIVGLNSVVLLKSISFAI